MVRNTLSAKERRSKESGAWNTRKGNPHRLSNPDVKLIQEEFLRYSRKVAGMKKARDSSRKVLQETA